MDFTPDKEFHLIFNRVSEIVDLTGAFSVVEINERLEATIKDVRRSRFLRKPRAKMIAKELEKLKDARFGNRIIKEASENPRGIVNLTLRYGRDKAKQILLERAKRRIGVRQVRRSTRRHRRRI